MTYIIADLPRKERDQLRDRRHKDLMQKAKKSEIAGLAYREWSKIPEVNRPDWPTFSRNFRENFNEKTKEGA